MKKFQSSISYWLFIPVLIVLFCYLIATIIEKDWFSSIIALALNLLVWSIVSKTYYEIVGSELKIVSGFIVNKKIQIKNISKIVKTNSLLSSPALSLTGRLEVFYNKYDSVIISPKEREEFISALKSINYEIEIKL